MALPTSCLLSASPRTHCDCLPDTPAALSSPLDWHLVSSSSALRLLQRDKIFYLSPELTCWASLASQFALGAFCLCLPSLELHAGFPACPVFCVANRDPNSSPETHIASAFPTWPSPSLGLCPFLNYKSVCAFPPLNCFLSGTYNNKKSNEHIYELQ